MCRHIVRNIYRNGLKSFVIVITSFLLFLIISELGIHIKEEKERLSNMYEVIPVEGKIHINSSSSNFIPIEIIDGLKKTGFIEEEYLETLYHGYQIYPHGNLSIIFEGNKVYHNNIEQSKVLGVSDLSKSAYIAKDITYEFGPAYQNVNFSSDDMICLISKNMFELDNYEFGDIILLYGEYIPEHYHTNPFDGIEQYKDGIPFQIVGTYELAKDSMNNMNNERIEYIVPVRALVNHIEDYFSNKIIETDYYYNGIHEIIAEPMVLSAEFKLKNTSNLNQFRSYLYENNLMKEDNNKRKGDYSFHLYDETLLSSTLPLRNSISFKQSLTKIILIVVSGLNLFMALIVTNKRTYDIALMRMLGKSKRTSYYTVLIEYLLLNALGILFAFVFSIIRSGGYRDIFDLGSSLIFIGSVIISSMLGIYIIIKKNSIRILLQKE